MSEIVSQEIYSCYENVQSYITNNLSSLLQYNNEENDKIYDVEFIIGNQEKGETLRKYKCIRSLFAIHSPVFKALLFGHMLESSCGINEPIIIADINYKAFEFLISFVYGLNPKINNKIVSNLFYVANKYLIFPLKKACIHFIINNLALTTTNNTNKFITILNEFDALKLHDDIDNILSHFNDYKKSQFINEIFSTNNIKNVQSKQMLAKLLQSNYISLKEEAIWEGTICWCKHQIELKKESSLLSIYDNNIDNILLIKEQSLDDDDNENDDNNVDINIIQEHESDAETNPKENDDNNNEWINEIKDFVPYIRFALMDDKYLEENILPLKNIYDNNNNNNVSFQNNPRYCRNQWGIYNNKYCKVSNNYKMINTIHNDNNAHSSWSSQIGYNQGIHIIKIKVLQCSGHFGWGIHNNSSISNIIQKQPCFFYRNSINNYVCCSQNNKTYGVFENITKDSANDQHTLKKYDEQTFNINDIISMEINCNDWNIKFFINDKIIGEVINVQNNQTYFPAICFQGTTHHYQLID